MKNYNDIVSVADIFRMKHVVECNYLTLVYPMDLGKEIRRTLAIWVFYKKNALKKV